MDHQISQLDHAISSIPSLQWLQSLLWRWWHTARIAVVRIHHSVIAVIRPVSCSIWERLCIWIGRGTSCRSNNSGDGLISAVERRWYCCCCCCSNNGGKRSHQHYVKLGGRDGKTGDVNFVSKLRNQRSRTRRSGPRSQFRRLLRSSIVRTSLVFSAALIMVRIATQYWTRRSRKKSIEKQRQVLLDASWSRGHSVKGVMLRDGRWLAYDEYGALQSSHRVVFFFHSLASSRLEMHPHADTIAKSLGLRVISIDRPGYGRSSTHEGRTYMSFVNDVCELARILGVSRYAVCGVGAGGPYALACALHNDNSNSNNSNDGHRTEMHELQERLERDQNPLLLDSMSSITTEMTLFTEHSTASSSTSAMDEDADSRVSPSDPLSYHYGGRIVAAAIISGDLPYRELSKEHFSSHLKDLWFLTQTMPTFVLKFFLHAELYASIFSNPERYTSSLQRERKKLYPHDGPELEMYMNTCVQQMREGMVVHGVQEPIRELTMTRGHWGFRLEDIHTTPVHIWHGKKDRLVPIKLVRQCFQRMAHRNRNVTLYEVPKKGHFFYLNRDYWLQIFECLSQAFDIEDR